MFFGRLMPWGVHFMAATYIQLKACVTRKTGLQPTKIVLSNFQKLSVTMSKLKTKVEASYDSSNHFIRKINVLGTASVHRQYACRAQEFRCWKSCYITMAAKTCAMHVKVIISPIHRRLCRDALPYPAILNWGTQCSDLLRMQLMKPPVPGDGAESSTTRIWFCESRCSTRLQAFLKSAGAEEKRWVPSLLSYLWPYYVIPEGFKVTASWIAHVPFAAFETRNVYMAYVPPECATVSLKRRACTVFDICGAIGTPSTTVLLKVPETG